DRVLQLVLADMGDGDWAFAFETDELYDLEAGFLEELHDVAVADGKIGRDDADPLHLIGGERRFAGGGAHRDGKAGVLFEIGLELTRHRIAAPEGLGRNAED